LYVFRGERGTALVLNTSSSIVGDARTPGFHPEARYEFRIDVDGDAIEDLAYRVTFGAADAAGRQALEVRGLVGADARNPEAEGTLLATGSTDETIVGLDGMRAWAGLAPDPFFIDPTVLP